LLLIMKSYGTNLVSQNAGGRQGRHSTDPQITNRIVRRRSGERDRTLRSAEYQVGRGRSLLPGWQTPMRVEISGTREAPSEHCTMDYNSINYSERHLYDSVHGAQTAGGNSAGAHEVITRTKLYSGRTPFDVSAPAGGNRGVNPQTQGNGGAGESRSAPLRSGMITSFERTVRH